MPSLSEEVFNNNSGHNTIDRNKDYQSSDYIEPLPINRKGTSTDCFEEMKKLRLDYPKNIIIGYININSVRNKFEQFSYLMKDLLDIIIIAETKLDSSFPSNPFTISGFRSPIRLDISSNSGGILVYIKDDILFKKIEGLEIPRDIQAIPIEIDIRKQKWLLLPLNSNPRQGPKYFVDNLGRIIDKYTPSRDNVLIIGDFNIVIGDNVMSTLIITYQLFSLYKGETCFKTSRGRSIDLMLTNRKHSFMKSQSFETGFSDYHHMIYTILKSAYVKLPPKIIKYRGYRNLQKEDSRETYILNFVKPLMLTIKFNIRP